MAGTQIGHDSRSITIRLSNNVMDRLSAEFAQNGYRALGGYIRAIVEHHALGGSILKREIKVVKRAKRQ
jgi:hypothetical protein